jgi:hypothetical protein
MRHVLDPALLQLDDYVRGRGSDTDVDAYETDLFERALGDSAPELSLRSGLERTLKEMKQRGTLDLWLTRSQVEGLSKQGLKVAYFELDMANPTQPEIAPDADLLVAKVPLDLSGVRRLEAELLADDGRILKTMPDIRFDSSDNAIFACCEADLARAAVSVERTTRFWAYDDGPERRLLLEVRAL